jgi:hypothetical protein
MTKGTEVALPLWLIDKDFSQMCSGALSKIGKVIKSLLNQ